MIFFRLHQPAAYYGVNSRPLENSQVLREIKKLSKFTKKQLSTYVTEIVKKIDKIVFTLCYHLQRLADQQIWRVRLRSWPTMSLSWLT